MRRAARVDANQGAVVEALRKAGASVRDQSGANNPNWRNAGHRVCVHCGGDYVHYSKTRKFCSMACYKATRPRQPKKQLKLTLVKPAPTPKAPREIRSAFVPCRQCGTEFKKYPSQTRMYCSYSCHLASGGAQRAGMASKRAVMRYGAKKDANHNEVVNALEKAGACVIDMSAVGGGFPDLIVGFRSITMLMEIKNPKTRYGRKGFNSNQLRWQETWAGGPVSLVDGPEAALRALGVLG